LGVTVGFLGGVIANKFQLFNDVTSPAIQVIKAVPVASFIILAFFWFKSDELPIFIAFLMVLPMVWSATQTALSGIDQKFIELARVYKLSPFKTFFKIKMPFITKTLLTTCLTALGFAWKSGIAAEIICRPQTALGTLLNDHKNYFDMPSVFALTVVVAALSIILEIVLKQAVRRVLNAKN
jgi:NitT/TauT family transport system permease protein